MRARVELSQLIRKIEFTETIKRRLIDEMKDAVESGQRVQREIDAHRAAAQSEEQEEPKLKEEDKKNLLRRQQGAQGRRSRRWPTSSSSRPTS